MMKIRFKRFHMTASAAIAAILQPADYVGQRYVTFRGGGKTPANYNLMGKTTMTAPEGYTSVEIRPKPLAYASPYTTT